VIFRNSGDIKKDEVDYIPLVGGKHISNQNTKVYYITPEQDSLTNPIPKISRFSKVINFLKSFGKAHVRQTTLKPFTVFGDPNIQKEAKRGTKLEPIRYLFARILNKLTLGQINGSSFEEFMTQS